MLHSELYFLLQLFMCPSASSSNYTENKFYTFFLTQAGEFHKLFLDLSLGWKGDFCLSWSILKEASLVFLHPTPPPFLWGHSPNPFQTVDPVPSKHLRFSDVEMQSFRDSLTSVPEKLHPRERSPTFSTWTSTSELGMEIITIPKFTIGTLLS